MGVDPAEGAWGLADAAGEDGAEGGGVPECATKKVSFLAATAYTRPHKAHAITQDALPTVFHSEWRAPDGRKAAILVNWTREEQAYDLQSPDVSAKGTLPPLSWKCVVIPDR